MLNETRHLQRNSEKILLIMDGYACYMSYRTLVLLCDNCVIVAALPVDYRHVLQTRDFRQEKAEFNAKNRFHCT